MLQTEFVKNLHNNYERLLLDEKPEEKRYQYCILNRGGIKGLLPCSLRYLNGQAYLYYDITSKQNITQLFQKRFITRGWIKDFLWGMRQIQLELGRFLLDERNVLWYPDQIFQDLENNIFSFLYVPYYKGDNGFEDFLEFLVEHIDYEDEILVGYVYKVYEQFQQNGEIYLQEHIFTDAEILEEQKVIEEYPGEEKGEEEERDQEKERGQEEFGRLRAKGSEGAKEQNAAINIQEKRGIFSFLDGKRHRSKEQRNKEERSRYRQELQISMEGVSVAEEVRYDTEEYGRTVYIEETQEPKGVTRRIYSPEGKILAWLDMEILTIGKKKEEADLALEDLSISRIHARIIKEGDDYYLEDMNSTNGTFKNGLRLEPYERRKLQEEDEIKLGKIILIFR